MKQIIPDSIYNGLPCSIVSAGTALGINDLNGLSRLVSDDLRKDGYLSLRGMNTLLRANMSVIRRRDFKRGERPTLMEWAKAHEGVKAVICLLGHFIYFDGQDYHSFFKNDTDPVVAVWEVK